MTKRQTEEASASFRRSRSTSADADEKLVKTAAKVVSRFSPLRAVRKDYTDCVTGARGLRHTKTLKERPKTGTSGGEGRGPGLRSLNRLTATPLWNEEVGRDAGMRAFSMYTAHDLFKIAQKSEAALSSLIYSSKRAEIIRTDGDIDLDKQVCAPPAPSRLLNDSWTSDQSHTQREIPEADTAEREERERAAAASQGACTYHGVLMSIGSAKEALTCDTARRKGPTDEFISETEKKEPDLLHTGEKTPPPVSVSPVSLSQPLPLCLRADYGRRKQEEARRNVKIAAEELGEEKENRERGPLCVRSVKPKDRAGAVRDFLLFSSKNNISSGTGKGGREEGKQEVGTRLETQNAPLPFFFRNQLPPVASLSLWPALEVSVQRNRVKRAVQWWRQIQGELKREGRLGREKNGSAKMAAEVLRELVELDMLHVVVQTLSSNGKTLESMTVTELSALVRVCKYYHQVQLALESVNVQSDLSNSVLEDDPVVPDEVNEARREGLLAMLSDALAEAREGAGGEKEAKEKDAKSSEDPRGNSFYTLWKRLKLTLALHFRKLNVQPRENDQSPAQWSPGGMSLTLQGNLVPLMRDTRETYNHAKALSMFLDRMAESARDTADKEVFNAAATENQSRMATSHKLLLKACLAEMQTRMQEATKHAAAASALLKRRRSQQQRSASISKEDASPSAGDGKRSSDEEGHSGRVAGGVLSRLSAHRGSQAAISLENMKKLESIMRNKEEDRGNERQSNKLNQSRQSNGRDSVQTAYSSSRSSSSKESFRSDVTDEEVYKQLFMREEGSKEDPSLALRTVLGGSGPSLTLSKTGPLRDRQQLQLQQGTSPGSRGGMLSPGAGGLLSQEDADADLALEKLLSRLRALMDAKLDEQYEGIDIRNNKKHAELIERLQAYQARSPVFKAGPGERRETLTGSDGDGGSEGDPYRKLPTLMAAQLPTSRRQTRRDRMSQKAIRSYTLPSEVRQRLEALLGHAAPSSFEVAVRRPSVKDEGLLNDTVRVSS
uniref:Uncharacterized protein n=1 Tax=Chromera velia CCMP2878 TaxID=1169474 RepID=A0A0K6S8V6_9ALVE|eukprot:Cvel_6728.t2-p1 / transcript=Cvel_6728.t2 / gene=Cvel_6728 / organism=Chromera_velia_CCMP2878 / gene_product=hypothetical protein / transcript_product=hypothetical protein / location=Cvel_scaffold336:42608-48306(+) / protein_length=1007 / sequence_SO=supercontig / SO=protein_coding / is_pseudo=false